MNNTHFPTMLSVVIPVYNEEDVLSALFTRLYAVLDQLGLPYEIIFVNDGSQDNSAALLREQWQQRPEVTQVVFFNGNYGQHMAIIAGFAQCRGGRIITLDADLQNPPEEIPKLLALMDQGFDYVGSIRRARKDLWWRHIASRLMNRLREKITKIKMTDQGCMLRAYSRSIIDTILSCREVNTFIPALAYSFAHRPTEIVVEHAERVAGESKYSLYRLLRVSLDLITGFSVLPLQLFSLVGMVLSGASAVFVCYLLGRRLLLGPEAEGVFTLFALTFFFIGILLFGIGLLGEYVGRIYQQVRERPRYVVEAVLTATPTGTVTPESMSTDVDHHKKSNAPR